MNSKYKYIHFAEAAGENKIVNNKPAYECRNNKTNDVLAIIFWHKPWKEYCFTQFKQSVIFNKSCLNDVQNFIEQLNPIKNEKRKN